MESQPQPRWALGYVSGVFDLFHIGHLNVIVQSRALCDRLVVGVVTDDVVRRVKGHDPVIPLSERVDIVRGLRDVDEVIVDPYPDKFDTWRHCLHYDVIFKGDDWQGTERAEQLAADLGGVGAQIHYFSYTSHTSSSLLRTVLSALARTPVEPFPDPPGAPVGVPPGAPVEVPVAPVGGSSSGGRCQACGAPFGQGNTQVPPRGVAAGQLGT